jgi:hypothetical protein
MHRKVAAALIAAFALGISGCGGDEPLTRAQLVRSVETACKQGLRKTQARTREGTGPESESQKRFVAAVVFGQRAIISRIEDLDAPDAAKDDFDVFKTAMQQRADAFDRIGSGTGAEVQRAITASQTQTEALTTRMAEAARRLGVEGCV